MKDIGSEIFNSRNEMYWEVDMAVNICTSKYEYLRNMQMFFTSLPFELLQPPRL